MIDTEAVEITIDDEYVSLEHSDDSVSVVSSSDAVDLSLSPSPKKESLTLPMTETRPSSDDKVIKLKIGLKTMKINRLLLEIAGIDIDSLMKIEKHGEIFYFCDEDPASFAELIVFVKSGSMHLPSSSSWEMREMLRRYRFVEKTRKILGDIDVLRELEEKLSQDTRLRIKLSDVPVPSVRPGRVLIRLPDGSPIVTTNRTLSRCQVFRERLESASDQNLLACGDSELDLPDGISKTDAVLLRKLISLLRHGVSTCDLPEFVQLLDSVGADYEFISPFVYPLVSNHLQTPTPGKWLVKSMIHASEVSARAIEQGATPRPAVPGTQIYPATDISCDFSGSTLIFPLRVSANGQPSLLHTLEVVIDLPLEEGWDTREDASFYDLIEELVIEGVHSEEESFVLQSDRNLLEILSSTTDRHPPPIMQASQMIYQENLITLLRCSFVVPLSEPLVIDRLYTLSLRIVEDTGFSSSLKILGAFVRAKCQWVMSHVRGKDPSSTQPVNDFHLPYVMTSWILGRFASRPFGLIDQHLCCLGTHQSIDRLRSIIIYPRSAIIEVCTVDRETNQIVEYYDQQQSRNDQYGSFGREIDAFYLLFGGNDRYQSELSCKVYDLMILSAKGVVPKVYLQGTRWSFV